MTESDDGRFSRLFDRAISACAQSQLLCTRCRESQARARASHASSKRIRELASDTRAAWAESNRLFATVKHEVELVALAMRDEGVNQALAAATVRAHVRFVLYDGGLREQEAESVVARASEWVEEIYRAA